jgi:hypothetical protein
MSLSAVAAFAAAVRSLHDSFITIASLADDHLGRAPDSVNWTDAKTARRFAHAAEALAADVAAYARSR